MALQLPFFYVEHRLQLGLGIDNTQLQHQWCLGFVYPELGAALVIRMGATAGKEGDDFMLTGFEVPDIKTLHAATKQSIDLLIAIQLAGYQLIIDFQLDRIQREVLTDVHQYINRDLTAGRIEQLFFENKQ